MGDFQRSPSKVWWVDDSHNWSISSTSPGSQDSGFSDTETSPSHGVKAKNSPNEQNLSENFKEKNSPRKNLLCHLSYQENRTPLSSQLNFKTFSEPVKKQRYHLDTSKINKRLFNEFRKEVEGNQYSSEDNANIELSSSHSNDSLQIATRRRRSNSFTKEHILSDSESELEALFETCRNPTFTSTPKNTKSPQNMRHVRNRRQSQKIKKSVGGNPPVVEKWLEEVRDLCEPECTTTLQCKSIAGDLAQKVATITVTITFSMREILSNADMVDKEYENVQNQNYYSGPLIQSFIGLITELCQSYQSRESINLIKMCDKIRCKNGSDVLQLIANVYKNWKLILENLLINEVQKLVELLEEPQSELYLRATLTALSSLALRRDELSSLFVSCGAISNLCILCERCEGSTVRSLILRALSTICNNLQAIKQFERSCGIEIISEVIGDESRPEPERSEAVALLAQVTAPWIEDNKGVKGLKDYLKTIIRALATFASKTKCCQNLLLCSAALANLSEMEEESMQFILKNNVVGKLLNAVKERGSRISPYILEQVAILLANVSAVKDASEMLIEENVPVFLLHFLMYNHSNEDVEKRLQQKSIIALSRLCSNKEAAEQVVDFDGVRRLVRLCRERDERHDSDAVLVAALATLRKISESCGTEVIDSQDALELVEPRLLDSFLAYSTQNESYV